eukprot:gene27733-4260_t
MPDELCTAFCTLLDNLAHVATVEEDTSDIHDGVRSDTSRSRSPSSDPNPHSPGDGRLRSLRSRASSAHGTHDGEETRSTGGVSPED